jgi:hypothetical protein
MLAALFFARSECQLLADSSYTQFQRVTVCYLAQSSYSESIISRVVNYCYRPEAAIR